MSIIITQTPPHAVFAGVPVIVRCATDMTQSANVRFPRIQLEITVNTDVDGVVESSTESLVYNLSADGNASFNISSVLESAVSNAEKFIVSDMGVTHVVPTTTYVLKLTEYYYDDGKNVKGSSASVESLVAIPGTLSDYERQTIPYDIEEHLLRPGFVMSHKPLTGDITVSGMPYVFPVAIMDHTADIVLSGPDSRVWDSVSVNGIKEAVINIPSNMERSNCKVSMDVGRYERSVYVRKPARNLRSFIFLNKFGMLESATAVCDEDKAVSIKTSTYSILPQIKSDAVRTLRSYTVEGDTEFSMSSGVVDSEWAEWWLYEFIQSPMVWMYNNGKWVQCAIIPESNNTVYKRSSVEAQQVKFTVRLSMKGIDKKVW